jgi:hypothetical protein
LKACQEEQTAADDQRTFRPVPARVAHPEPVKEDEPMTRPLFWPLAIHIRTKGPKPMKLPHETTATFGTACARLHPNARAMVILPKSMDR